MAVSVATEHTARGWWLQEAEPAAAAPAAGGRARRRPGGGGRRIHGDVDGVVRLASSSPRPAWSCWRPSAAARGPSGRNGGFVNAMWFSLPALRQRFGDAAALRLTPGGRGRGSRARALVRGATGGRLVPRRRLPPGLDGSGARRLLAGGRRRLRRAGRCRRLPAAVGGRGADPLRFADLPSRGLLPGGRHGAAGAVGARASRPPPASAG